MANPPSVQQIEKLLESFKTGLTKSFRPEHLQLLADNHYDDQRTILASNMTNLMEIGLPLGKARLLLTAAAKAMKKRRGALYTRRICNGYKGESQKPDNKADSTDTVSAETPISSNQHDHLAVKALSSVSTTILNEALERLNINVIQLEMPPSLPKPLALAPSWPGKGGATGAAKILFPDLAKFLPEHIGVYRVEGIPWLAAEFEDANVSISNGSVDAVFGYKAGIEEILEPYLVTGYELKEPEETSTAGAKGQAILEFLAFCTRAPILQHGAASPVWWMGDLANITYKFEFPKPNQLAITEMRDPSAAIHEMMQYLSRLPQYNDPVMIEAWTVFPPDILVWDTLPASRQCGGSNPSQPSDNPLPGAKRKNEDCAGDRKDNYPAFLRRQILENGEYEDEIQQEARFHKVLHDVCGQLFLPEAQRNLHLMNFGVNCPGSSKDDPLSSDIMEIPDAL